MCAVFVEAGVRRAARTDVPQQAIVNGLRDAGVKVWVIKQPCDLLTLYRSRWLPLEVKTRKRYDQQKQSAFIELTGTPVVRSVSEALKAVGAST